MHTSEHIKASPNYKWLILANVSVGTFMATLDSSIVNVALPTLSAGLKADLTTLQWVVTAYLLTTSCLLPVFGRVADLVGRKRIFSLGFIVFTLGSVLCGLAPNIWFLIGMRVVQAIGASMLMSNSAAIIIATFPQQERGRALGLSGSVVALGILTGPALGGILVGLVSWRAIFYINLPIGIIGYLAAQIILPIDSPGKDKETFDYAGATLFSTGMIILLLAVNYAKDWGWTSLGILSGLGLGLVLLTLFLINELQIKFPLIDFSLFRIRPFLVGNLSGLLSFMTIFATTILMPFYLQNVLNFTPLKVGLLLTAFPLVMAVVAPLSGHASDKIGPVVLTSSGLLISSLGLFYLSTLGTSSNFCQVLPGPLLMGLGAGLFQSPNNSSIMSSVPPPKLGVAGGINALVRHIGMVLGIAISVSIFENLGGVTSPAPNQINTFMSAFQTVMLTGMTIALVAVVISLNRKSYAKANN